MRCLDCEAPDTLRGGPVPDGAIACCVEHFKKRAESFFPQLPIDNLLADQFSYLIDGGQRVYWRPAA